VTHPFDSLRQGYHERNEALAGRRYEHDRVMFVLSMFRYSKPHVRDICRRASERGRADLTFEDFREEAPTFPLWLACDAMPGAKLHTDVRVLLPSLYRNFAAAPFAALYHNLLEEVGDRLGDRTLGIVFPRKGVRHGLVIHGAGLETLPYTGTSVVHEVGGDASATLYVRPFQAVLAAIDNRGHGWRRDS
jgi:hypothetical protein